MTPPSYADVRANLDLQIEQRDRLILRITELQAEERRTRLQIIAAERIVEQYEHMLKELSGAQEKA